MPLASPDCLRLESNRGEDWVDKKRTGAWHMDKAEVQEMIATLYLRLNGYFTSGLIVHHKDTGKVTTEVDVLAVRFPWHAQPDRELESDRELNCPAGEIDIIIGEVKSRRQQLQFNCSLRESPEALSRVLQWIGAFEPQEISDLASHICSALTPEALLKPDPPSVQGPRSIRIRGVLFSPECDSRRDNQPWFLPGPPIFDYLWRCLNPKVPRPSSATRYDFGLWGPGLEPLVRYVKQSAKPAGFDPFFADFTKWVDQQVLSN